MCRPFVTLCKLASKKPMLAFWKQAPIQALVLIILSLVRGTATAASFFHMPVQCELHDRENKSCAIRDSFPPVCYLNSPHTPEVMHVLRSVTSPFMDRFQVAYAESWWCPTPISCMPMPSQTSPIPFPQAEEKKGSPRQKCRERGKTLRWLETVSDPFLVFDAIYVLSAVCVVQCM